MIASLNGVIQHKDAESAVIECGGVGYGVSMSLASLAKMGSEGDEVRLLIHTHLSQDSLRLYGFLEAAERQTFEVLIATTGVGPRLALAILSTLSPHDLSDVVRRGDKGMLVKIPGVGAKKAARLLVELKDRLPQGSDAPGAPAAQEQGPETNITSALANLGFSDSVAEHAAKKVLEQNPGSQDLSKLVREALRIATAG